MAKFTVSIDTGEIPGGTALLFILAEMIKDVPLIVEQKTVTVRDYTDQGEVVAKIRRRE